MCTPRLRQSMLSPTRSLPRSGGLTHLISGELGGFLLRTITRICLWGDACALLSARGLVVCSAEASNALLHQMRRSLAHIAARACNQAGKADFRGALLMLGARRLGSMLHREGLMCDAFVRHMHGPRASTNFESKALAALQLHGLTAQRRAALIVLSSVTSLMSNVGLGTYACSSASLEGLSTCRRANAAAGCSLQLALIHSGVTLDADA